jgi:tryptophanyl-tRNA synthetase
MRVLSGIQPTGNLHLGNYFGMMKSVLESQKKHDLYCFIVNLHALTTSRDANVLAKQTLEAATDFLALGLDPKKTTFWIQSDVPEVTELTWILSNVTPMGLLERCHSYKDKVANGLKPHHGLFSYPVLMTADILIMKGQKIPVGMDQKQHVEVSRDIAQRFNRQYGPIFTVPEPDIQMGGRMIPGTDGRKMSKVYNNTIEIFCSKDELRKRVMALKTDSTPVGEIKDIHENSLYLLYSLFLGDKEKAALLKRFGQKGLRYSDIKSEIVECIWKYFGPYRKVREDYAKQPQMVMKLLDQGAQKARDTARQTLHDVKHKIGLNYKGATS